MLREDTVVSLHYHGVTEFSRRSIALVSVRKVNVAFTRCARDPRQPDAVERKRGLERNLAFCALRVCNAVCCI